jgi:hypothetical protein
MTAVGIIDKQTVPLEDAWYVEYRYDYTIEPPYRYHLINRLKGVRPIYIANTSTDTRKYPTI